MRFVWGDFFGYGGIGIIYYNGFGWFFAHIIAIAAIILIIIGAVTAFKLLTYGRFKKR